MKKDWAEQKATIYMMLEYIWTVSTKKMHFGKMYIKSFNYARILAVFAVIKLFFVGKLWFKTEQYTLPKEIVIDRQHDLCSSSSFKSSAPSL